MLPTSLTPIAADIVQRCRMTGNCLVTVESCTGGLLAALLTSIAGSSDVVWGGFVTYANEAKIRMVGVEEQCLQHYGAVSKETAQAMAEGGLLHSGATVSIAITGIAGPTGGTPTKPVGLVHFAVAMRGNALLHHQEQFAGNREEIRSQAVETALMLLKKCLTA